EASVRCDVSRRMANSGGCLGQRNNLIGTQEPNQSSEVVSAQSLEIGPPLIGPGRQAEQVTRGPTPAFPLLTPLRKEAPTTFDCLLPIGVIDKVGTALLQFTETTTETTYTTKVTLWVVYCATATRKCMGFVVNVVFVVSRCQFDLPDDVEIFA